MFTVDKILTAVTAAYIEALYFTDTGEPEQPAASAGLSLQLRLKCWSDCADFLGLCDRLGLLEKYRESGRTWDSFGHDFWLTRNGHGAGFWDRGLCALGQALSDAADTMGSVDTYESDTGELCAC